RRKLISWGFNIMDTSTGVTTSEQSPARTVAIFDHATFKRVLCSSMATELNNYLAIIWVKTAELPKGMLDVLNIPVKTLTLPLRTFAIANVCDEFFGTSHKKELSQNEFSSIWPRLNLKLIVIEDNHADLQLLQIFLQKLKCKMKIIESASDLSTIMHPEQFNAILISQPLLEQQPQIPGLPVIVVSPPGSTTENLSEYSSLIEGVLEKPVQPSKLIPLLDHFIATNKLGKTQTFSIH
ncbi:hypothetical protein BVX99_00360, partial [bacterium F16]